MAGTRIGVDYRTLQDGARSLMTTIEELGTRNQQLYTQVTNLFDVWEGQAKPQYQDDYQRVSNNVQQTLDVATQLAKAVEQYAQEIEAVENAHKNSKISG